LFDLWYDYGPEKLNIRDFDSILTYYVMGRHTICTYSDRCLGFVVIEHTGEAFCCEFFVEPRWRLGNILDTPLAELAAAPKLKEFARTKQNLAAKCTLCKYLSLCRGGCLKDRLRFADDPAQPSYFCEGYRQFFDHAVPKFMQLAAATEQGLAGRRTRSAHKVRLRIPK